MARASLRLVTAGPVAASLPTLPKTVRLYDGALDHAASLKSAAGRVFTSTVGFTTPAAKASALRDLREMERLVRLMKAGLANA
jgi:hypothetical protein